MVRRGALPSTGLRCSETSWLTEAEEHLHYCEWSDCASVSTGCPKRGHGGDPGGLCRREDLVGRERGDEVTYVADGDGKRQVAIQLGC